MFSLVLDFECSLMQLNEYLSVKQSLCRTQIFHGKSQGHHESRRKRRDRDVVAYTVILCADIGNTCLYVSSS